MQPEADTLLCGNVPTDADAVRPNQLHACRAVADLCRAGSHEGGAATAWPVVRRETAVAGGTVNQRRRSNVLVTDTAWPSIQVEAEVLACVGADVTLAETEEEAVLLSLVGDADAILTCWAAVPATMIRAGTRLQVVGRFGIGVDNIAVEEATRRGIPVTNVPAYCLDEVSEHVLALIFAFGRRIHEYDRRVRSGVWETRASAPLHRIRGSTLGIVGFGRIGRTLARKAVALGMRVVASDPYLDPSMFESEGCLGYSLSGLLAEADYLSLHVPLTPSTRHLIGEAELRRMKPGAFIINASRGGVVDQEVLIRALREGWIAGAGLDVFEPERLPPSHPIFSLPNVLATPHVAFYSEESLHDLRTAASANVAAILSGHRPQSIVNPEVLSLPRWAHLL